ncbi:MAG TPA: hypothetical protein VF070_23375 [Streptosporangiaceae bacterium]
MVRRVVTRFAELVCPPGVRTAGRTELLLAEFDLLRGALRPAARRMLSAAFVSFDQGARLYPPGRGRAFVRMDERVAEGYLRAVLARGDVIAALAERLKGLIVMCYYALPEVQREIGYEPGPYIAAVTRRRLERYGAEIRAHEEKQ